MTSPQAEVHSALAELLLDKQLHLKSDEHVVSVIQGLIEKHGADLVREWRDESRKHKHSIVHILVNFDKQGALKAIAPALGQINTPRASDRCTPLHLSIWKKNLALSGLLIDLGADSTLKNDYGEDCQKLKEEVAKQNNIVFLDLELTAVPSDPAASILEVAIVVTDMHLTEISRKSWVVRKTAEELAKLPRWHQEHFSSNESGGNGLFDECLSSDAAMPLEDVADHVLEFVKREHLLPRRIFRPRGPRGAQEGNPGSVRLHEPSNHRRVDRPQPVRQVETLGSDRPARSGGRGAPGHVRCRPLHRNAQVLQATLVGRLDVDFSTHLL